jgi:hypothetical protein
MNGAEGRGGRIVRLEVEGVKRVTAVTLEIDPKTSLVKVRGRNGEGKSSTIDTIMYILGGKRTHPPKVIHEGLEHARGLIETTGQLIAERRWTKNDAGQEVSVVEVRSTDGQKFRGPQAILDALCGPETFDPDHFLKSDPKAQLDVLRRVVGIDFSQLDGRRLKFYDDRTAANRELAQLKARLVSMPDESGKLERVDVAALLEQEKGYQASATRRASLEGAATAAKVARVALEVSVREAETVWRNALAKLGVAKSGEAEVAKALEVQPALDEAARAQVLSKIANGSDLNLRAAKQEERGHLALKVSNAEALVKKLDASIAAIDDEKQKTVAAVKFPVEGLGFGEHGPSFKGFPLEQASDAERIRVAVGIGLAMHSELRVLRVRNGSLLDDRSLALLDQAVTELDGQCFVEVVGTEGDGFLIEDGALKSVNGSPP